MRLRSTIKCNKQNHMKITELFSPNFRSGQSQMFFKIGVLKVFAKFTGKPLCQSLFFNKVTKFLRKRF